MPLLIFKNPFEASKKRKTDDAELVGELLGPEEEAEMREAMGDQPIEKDAGGDDSIRLSEEEEAAKKKVEEEISPEQRWREYVEWAEEFGETDEWVGETFTFNDDGSVEVEGGLNLSFTKITELPKGLKNIGSGLNLTDCTGLKSLEHMPSSIEGDLILINCTGLKSLEHLPSSIEGELDLRGCMKIKDIPRGIKIREKIILDQTQIELKANAEAKGYKVMVIKE